MDFGANCTIHFSTYLLAISDIIENALLWIIIATGFDSSLAKTASIATQIKFGTVFLELGFTLLGLAIVTFRLDAGSAF